MRQSRSANPRRNLICIQRYLSIKLSSDIDTISLVLITDLLVFCLFITYPMLYSFILLLLHICLWISCPQFLNCRSFPLMHWVDALTRICNPLPSSGFVVYLLSNIILRSLDQRVNWGPVFCGLS